VGGGRYQHKQELGMKEKIRGGWPHVSFRPWRGETNGFTSWCDAIFRENSRISHQGWWNDDQALLGEIAKYNWDSSSFFSSETKFQILKSSQFDR
jgi:hypothetical protein